MKFKIGVFFILLLIVGIIFLKWQQSQKLDVEIIYDSAIPALPIDVLKNLRYLSDAGKKELFQSFSQQFPVDKIVRKIESSIRNPQIVLWFTDHFGQISRKNISWYKENVLEPLQSSQSLFWLVDLAAWQLLSIKEEDLLKSVDFQAFLEKQTQGGSNRAECSLITNEATVLKIPNDLASYAVLRSRDFFIWLNQLTFPIDMVDPLIADFLIRKDLRTGSARFSLRQLGYQPQFLNTWSESLQLNLLDADNSQIFPLLQYLEGVYYALKIVEDCSRRGEKECNIVFLLPNKEFTYYMVQGEKSPFDTFRRVITSFISKQESYQRVSTIKIYFYPFSYGSGFYDQPYEEQGVSVSNDELISLLKFKT